MKIQGGMCTLCLENCENFKAIVGKTRSILDILLLKIDFTVTQVPVMCQNCEEIVIKCFDFKTKCLKTQNYIVPFLYNKDVVKLDLKDVYLSRNVTGIGVSEDHDICVFCMGLINNYSALSFDVEDGDVMLEEMIEQCLPELDLNIIKKPVICTSCHGSLEDCFNFVKNCLVVREKIKKYCETSDINSQGQIELSSSLQLTKRDVITRKVDGNWVDIIKVEEPGDRKSLGEREIGNGGGTVKIEQIFFDDSEDANKDAENKNKHFMEMNDQQVNNEHQFTPKNMLADAEENNKLDSIKIEEIFCEENETKHKHVEMEDQIFLYNEEIEIKPDEQDFNRFEDGTVLPQSEVTRRLHRRKKCSLLNLESDKSNPHIKHTLTKKHVSKIRKSSINHEGSKEHLLVHPSEVTMYKCDFCLYQTKLKSNLKTHLILHKNLSEVTMYKCEYCSFQTKYKHGLKGHLLTHKSPSEVTMYKCDYCSFQTKHKNNLKLHLLIHKSPSEVNMYNCDSCSFQARNYYYFKLHLLTHKDPSEETVFKCHSCSFQTKHKSNLISHFLIHRDPSAVTKYKCDFCSVQTKRKVGLKKHLKLHKNPSDVTMYKCDHCSFQTRHKFNLKKHLILRHKSPSEVTMYKCEYCSFQAKLECYLKRHLVLHKSPSEVTMYKCDYCSFQTKRKCYLKHHELRHKNSQKQQ